jgi:hypothetical protein
LISKWLHHGLPNWYVVYVFYGGLSEEIKWNKCALWRIFSRLYYYKCMKIIRHNASNYGSLDIWSWRWRMNQNWTRLRSRFFSNRKNIWTCWEISCRYKYCLACHTSCCRTN